MATGKIIGQIEVSSGNVKIIGSDGIVREPVYGGFLYEGEEVISNDANALFQVKYMTLPEATAYDGVFKILADGSVVAGMDSMTNVDTLETEATDEAVEDLETAAGEESIDGSSNFTPTDIVAESRVQDFSRSPNPAVDGLGGVEIGADMAANPYQEADVPTETPNNPPVSESEDITKIADHEIIDMDVQPTLEGTSVYEHNGWYGIRDAGQDDSVHGNPLIDSHGEDEGIKFIFTNDINEATFEFKNVGDNPQDNDNILIELWNDGEKLDVDVDTNGINNFTEFVINENIAFDEVRIIAKDQIEGNENIPTEFRVSSVVATDLDRDWVLPFVIDDSMLLANDIDIDDDALHIELVDGNLYASDGITVIGSVDVITSGDNIGDIQITPEPVVDFDSHAPDYASFNYVVVDEDGLSSEISTATIDVAIGEVTVPEVSYNHTTGEFIIGTDSNIEFPDVLSDNILTVSDTLNLSNVSDINTLELSSTASIVGSSESGFINPDDVINATDVDNVLVIHSADSGDVSGQVYVHESFGDASGYEGGSIPDLGVEGIYYNLYDYNDGTATLLVEIEPPIDVV